MRFSDGAAGALQEQFGGDGLARSAQRAADAQRRRQAGFEVEVTGAVVRRETD